MNRSIFEYSSYKSFVDDWLKAQPKKGHGLRRKFAEAIGTQTGYITFVLSGDGNFASEQAFAVAKFMGLSQDERKYFLLLVQLERAGTQDFRRFIEDELQQIRDERRDLSNVIDAESFTSDVDQVRYFSSWLYACVHVMVTCERFRKSRAEMAKALGLAIEQINEVVAFLLRAGLLIEQNGMLEAGKARLHLGSQSPYLPKHHTNWNIFALQKILTDHQAGLHFSGVVSLSKADVEKIQSIYTRAIEDANEVVKESPGERICAFTVNFMEIC